MKKKRKVYKPEQQLTIRLPVAERDRMVATSASLGVSQSMFVRAAIRALVLKVGAA